MDRYMAAAFIGDMMQRTHQSARTPNDGALINEFCTNVHCRNVAAGWWNDLHTGEDMHGKRNAGELLCLVHSEVSEGYDGFEGDLNDDKLPHRSMLEVELVDVLIRVFDMGGGFDLNLGAAYLLLDEPLNHGANAYQTYQDMCCIHRAIDRAMEGHRKNKQCPQHPDVSMLAMGLAEVVLRVFHLGHKLGLDLGGAYVEKLEFNASRLDHKPEHRKVAGGKAY